MKFCKCEILALLLLMIGGLNWGLVGIFDWNLVTFLFGDMSIVARIVYALVGFSAIYFIIRLPIAMGYHLPHRPHAA